VALVGVGAPVQTSFDELGTPLREVDFTVVDLETTGGSPASAQITEVGAVRVRGGQVLGEFQTLVRPTCTIPPFITVLTGITDAAVASAPGIGAVLPAFLEFARGSVLVAHNAPFDVGFLRAGCANLELAWPPFPTLDTVRLARRVLGRDEAPDCRLATLARLFRTGTEPSHRALDDARATVDVLHGLIERVGNLGVHSLEELTNFSSRVPPAVRRKRHLAESLPHAPGVYLFRDARDRVLYVGTSRDLRTRVRSYFTAAETRRRMVEMVGLAARVDHVVCAHALEAQVRELRLIAGQQPPYNRRSRFPERGAYLHLTREAFPRLSVVRAPRHPDGIYVGPFSSPASAREARAALFAALPLRQCTSRLPARPSGRHRSCVLAELGHCGAPCVGGQSRQDYADVVAAAVRAMIADPAPVIEAARARMSRLALEERFEEAAAVRDRVRTFVRGSARAQHRSQLSCLELLVAARPAPGPGPGPWEVAVIRRGRLAGAGVTTPGMAVRASIEAIVATSETVLATAGPAALAEETDVVLRWLAQPGVRLVDSSGAWSSPAFGAQSRWRALDEVPGGWRGAASMPA
jgi:DNA polymerase-3 subunit epsilon